MVMAGLGGIGAGILGVAALSGSIDIPTGERAKFEQVIREYILANPEIIPEAMERLRTRETAQQIALRRSAIETPYAGAWAGNPDGDAVLVVYYDYACGFCRRSLPDIERLLDEDKNLKIVFRELPILTAESEQAAKMSLAAARQGKFKIFHDALYKFEQPSAEAIGAAARQAGIDVQQASLAIGSSDVAQEIQNNIETARALQFGGTPSWVIGDQVLNGAIGYGALSKAVAVARARKS